jgi:hypothetical protein
VVKNEAATWKPKLRLTREQSDDQQALEDEIKFAKKEVDEAAGDADKLAAANASLAAKEAELKAMLDGFEARGRLCARDAARGCKLGAAARRARRLRARRRAGARRSVVTATLTLCACQLSRSGRAHGRPCAAGAALPRSSALRAAPLRARHAAGQREGAAGRCARVPPPPR